MRARQLTADEQYWDGGIDWAPDGKSLAFHRFWVATGSRPQWHPGQGPTFDPYLRMKWAFQGICSVDVESKALRPLVSNGVDPRYSPTGGSLAYLQVRRIPNGSLPPGDDWMETSVAVLSLATLRTRVVCYAPSRSPTWSPHGRRLCYLRAGDGEAEYVVSDADGQNARALRLPRPRPRRRELPLFFIPGVHDPEEIRVDPGPLYVDYRAPLVSGDYIPLRAAWSPDGEHIALPQTLHYYFRDADRTFYAWDRLWMVRADGRDPRLLVEADVTRPYWDYTRIWDTQWLRSGKALLFNRSTESEEDNSPGWGFGPYRLAMDPPRSPSEKGYRPPADPTAEGSFVKGWRWGEQWLKPVPDSVGAKIGTQWGVDEQGAPVPLTGAGADPVWSPDGTRIAFVRDGHVWVVDVPRGAGGK